MTKSLRILMVEDSQDDQLMIERELSKAGLQCSLERAESADALDALLRKDGWDVVLSDFKLPGFDGLSALKMCREALPHVPFILVSGAIGEDNAVMVMKAGAADYVAKDRLARLPIAITNALAANEESLLRRKAEETLQVQTNRLAAALRFLPLGIYQATGNFSRTYVSDGIGRLSGFPPEAFIADPQLWPSRLHPDDRDRVLITFPEVFSRQELVVQYRWRHADGSYRFFQDMAVALPPQDGSAPEFIGVWLDVTDEVGRAEELRDATRMLLQSQKMEVVGRLAGGVAHDFNNILTAINGYSHFLLQSLPPGDAKRADVEEIRKAGERASGLTRQLLAFSRQQIIAPTVLEAGPLITGVLKMLKRIVGEDIALETATAPEAGRFKGDPGQVEQILLNLVVNARDAMPKGGKIKIAALAAEFGAEGAAMQIPVKPGAYVGFSVSDTGAGMTGEVMDHLFEPFFTTKEQGKGTGLGLATVYGIVKRSGGGIRVESRPGQGTVFEVYFPRIKDPASAPHGEATAPKAAGGSETVLLVEDDAAVRGFVERALRELGYSVLTAADPAEAIALFDRDGARVDLVLTDVVMPQMHGPELIKLLRARRPGIKAIYMSGYTDMNHPHLELSEGGAPFLQKPLEPAVLERAVRRTLDGPGLPPPPAS